MMIIPPERDLCNTICKDEYLATGDIHANNNIVLSGTGWWDEKEETFGSALCKSSFYND